MQAAVASLIVGEKINTTFEKSKKPRPSIGAEAFALNRQSVQFNIICAYKHERNFFYINVTAV